MKTPESFVEILRRRSIEQADREAYVMLTNRGRNATPVTYQSLDEKVRSIAAHLQELSSRGDRVLIIYPPGLDYIYAFYACLYAGVIAVPSYPPTRAGGNRSSDRLMAIARNAGVTCILTVSDLLIGLRKHFDDASYAAPLRWIATDMLVSDPDAWRPHDVCLNDLAFLQYTSGSTGEPKGVMVSHGNLLGNSELIRDRFSHTTESQGVIWLPPYHDMGLIGGVLQPLYVGFPTVLMSPVSFVQSPLLWLETISKYRATTSGGSDFAYTQCVRDITEEQCSTLDLSSWTVAFTGAEPIRRDTLDRFSKKFASAGFDPQSFYPCYGLAESTLFVSGSATGNGFRHVTVNSQSLAQDLVVEESDPQAATLSLVGCGLAAQKDHELVLVDPTTLEPVAENQVGEVWVRGPSVAQGYWHDAATTGNAFGAHLSTGEGPYLRCGDLGFLRAGELYISGRIKDLIIVRGRNHYPHDIESTVALSDPAGCGSGVLAAFLDDHHELVVLCEGAAIPELEADNLWRKASHAVMQVHGLRLAVLAFVKPRSLPRTSSGKLRRFVCRGSYQSGQLTINQRLSAGDATSDAVAAVLHVPELASVPATVAATAAGNELRHWLQSAIAQATRQPLQMINADREFFEVGLDSLELTRIAHELENKLGRAVDTALFFDFPTINRLVEHLCGETTIASLPRSVLSAQQKEVNKQAVIGLSCRFPGGAHSSTFWQLLEEGRDAVTEVPHERWDWKNAQQQSDAVISKWGGFLENVDLFDADLFNVATREATRMDPQHRVLLELALEALQDANLSTEKLKGSRTGVFIGISSSDYMILHGQEHQFDAYSGIGNAHSAAANRISYYFDFYGPSLVVDTACSSSLVALHLACQALQSGECDLALVGGINLMLSPHLHAVFSQGGMLASDGCCKTFDDSADGYVRGEGAGFIVLRRLSDAVALRDHVLACVRGSAINQDGRTNGITAPSSRAQEAVIRAALDSAQLDSSKVSYVEAHGTGTKLGDPIEYRALRNAYSTSERKTPLLVGSVKTNIGHLEAAAGIAGIIKVVLALRHRVIPAHLHFKRLNQQISDVTSNIEVCQTSRSWEGADGSRVAGISSFGFGGTNCHVIISDVEQAKALTENKARLAPVLTLSAASQSALRDMCARYAERLSSASEQQLAALCYASNISRSSFEHRWAEVASNSANVLRKLTQSAQSLESKPLRRAPGVIFAFSGQGTQLPGMGRAIEQCFPVFKEALDRCDALLRPSWNQVALRDVLYSEPVNGETLMNRTDYAQPAIFSYQYALAQLWMSLGVKPAAVLGHSLGEYVAACIAGVMTLEQSLLLLVARANLMQTVRNDGAMVALYTNPIRATQLLESFAGRVSLAAINSPEIVVVSGRDSAVHELCELAGAEKVQFKKLNGSRAFHSVELDGILDEYERIANTISYSVPALPWFCNVDGKAASAEVPVTGRYWREQLRGTVQFASALTEAMSTGASVLLEVGADVTLCTLAGRTIASNMLKCIPSARAQRDECTALSEALAALYKVGVRVDWAALHSNTVYERVDLPAYPFNRKRFWLTATPISAQSSRFVTMKKHENTSSSAEQASHNPSLMDEVRQLVATLLEVDVGQLDNDAPFLELGADSLILLSATQAIEDKYNIHLSISQLFGDVSTIRALVAFIETNAVILAVNNSVHEMEEVMVEEEQIVVKPRIGNLSQEVERHASTGIADLLTAQLQIMSEQLSLLKGEGAGVVARSASVASASVASAVPAPVKTPKVESRQPNAVAAKSEAPARFSWAKVANDGHQSGGLPAWARPPVLVSDTSDNQMKACADELLAFHISRTPISKSLTQQFRPVLADNRASAGFRLSTKEGVYPIVGKSAKGSRMWDIDGNEYIDFTMGFGVNLFGHSPDFIVDELHKQIDDGFQLGPQNDQAGIVAERMIKLTKQERVAFCNSGSEAVMTAVRLARAVTKRTKIVIFSGSYHGTFDGVLGRARVSNGELMTVPVAPGTPESFVEREVLVLEYGQDEALHILREKADQIAAVIVEPVQSRYPGNQPVEFLRALRALTAEHSIAMIWDEVITGFRAAPGGAQEYFGISADIATYGKIIGGGMPIGVVAGKARFMDAIDGGSWTYGDDSHPNTEQTFFAGTFSKHPLAMRAAVAVLDQIEAGGPMLQKTLNQRTADLAQELNAFFGAEDIPLRIEHFTSLFRFAFSGNMDLLFMKLMSKGIYIWEGRNCFLSTAHTDEDVHLLVEAVKSSVIEFRDNGFFLTSTIVSVLALNPSQQRFARWSNSADDFPVSHIPFALRLTGGNLQAQVLEDAFNQVIARHDGLRASFDGAIEHQRFASEARIVLAQLDLSEIDVSQQEQAIQEWQQIEVARPFVMSVAPLLRATLLRLSALEYVLHITVHHVICDGLSLALLLDEVSSICAANGKVLGMSKALSFSADLLIDRASEATPEGRAYWKKQVAAPLPEQLPVFPVDAVASAGARMRMVLPTEQYSAIKSTAKHHKCTPFMVLFSVFSLLLPEKNGKQDTLIGVPWIDRMPQSGQVLLGCFVKLLPIRCQVMPELGFDGMVKQSKEKLLNAYRHSFDVSEAGQWVPQATFNLEPQSMPQQFAGCQVELVECPVTNVEFDVMLNVTEVDGAFCLDLDYRRRNLTESAAREWLERYSEILNQALEQVTQA